MSIYRGWRRPSGRSDVVRSDGRHDQFLRRPKGRPTVVAVPWDWGTESERSYELAIAILYDWGMPLEMALMWAEQFSVDVVNHLNQYHWTLTECELGHWLVDALWLALQAGAEAAKGE